MTITRYIPLVHFLILDEGRAVAVCRMQDPGRAKLTTIPQEVTCGECRACLHRVRLAENFRRRHVRGTDVPSG